MGKVGDAMNRKLYTISEAAAMIDGLSEYRVRQMCRNGELHCFKAGRKYLISEDSHMRAVFGDDSRDKDKNAS